VWVGRCMSYSSINIFDSYIQTHSHKRSFANFFSLIMSFSCKQNDHIRKYWMTKDILSNRIGAFVVVVWAEEYLQFGRGESFYSFHYSAHQIITAIFSLWPQNLLCLIYLAFITCTYEDNIDTQIITIRYSNHEPQKWLMTSWSLAECTTLVCSRKGLLQSCFVHTMIRGSTVKVNVMWLGILDCFFHKKNTLASHNHELQQNKQQIIPIT